MECCFVDPQEWAEANFSECDFGDKRLTKRLVNYAAAIAARPDLATPQQTREWKDCKGIYRFMNNDKVTVEKIIETHCRRTRSHARTGVWLSICDTTEVDYTSRKDVEGLGPIGNGIGRGFMLHSSIFVAAESDEIVGLGGQELFYRKPKPANDNSQRRKKRARESEVWGRLADQVGSPADGATIIHVCDRAADDFEVFCHCLKNGAGWIVRAQHLARRIRPFDALAPDNPQAVATQSLQDYVNSLTLLGTYELHLRATKTQPARIATIEVRRGSIWMPRTTPCSAWVKKNGPQFIRMDVVEVREVGSGKNVEPLYWVLLTHSRVKDFEDAWVVISYYEKRPLVEEYHKAAKTGCQIEARLYRTARRLGRVVAILAVLAIRLVQMKSVARVEPNRPAIEVVPKEWVEALCDYKCEQRPNQVDKWNPKTLSTYDCFRGIATLGGFLGRKSDGQPGWITNWRGVKELLVMIEARKRIGRRHGSALVFGLEGESSLHVRGNELYGY